MESQKLLTELRNSLANVPGVNRLLEEKQAVSVLRLSGIIADSSGSKRGTFSHARIKNAIDKAFKKTKLAVALVLNCPGGSPAQTSLIASHIRRLSAEKEIPVYCFVEDVAASGGYWLACCAEEIHAQESSIVGSIGVISASFDLQELIEKHGVKRRLYTSGTDKSFMDPFLPVKEKDVERLKEIQSSIHQDFIAWVRQRRGDKLHAPDRELFEGAFWTATDAMERGLIDGVGDYQSFMKEKYGEKVKFVDCMPEKAKFPLSLLGARLDIASADIVDDAITALETRAAWSRFGL